MEPSNVALQDTPGTPSPPNCAAVPIPFLLRQTRAAGDRQPNPNSKRSQKRLQKRMRLAENLNAAGSSTAGKDADQHDGDASSVHSDSIPPSLVIDQSALPPPIPGRCHFFLWGKNRYCRQLLPATTAEVMCAEHRLAENVPGASTTDRVPCPYDPKHTVDVKSMRAHLFRCNSRPLPPPEYIVKGVNLGRSRPAPPPPPSSEDPAPLTARERLKLLSNDEFDDLVAKIRGMYDLVPQRPREQLHHEVGKQLKGTAHASKHPAQQSSLVGHLARYDALKRDNIFVEFGAGRAELSLFVRGAVGDPSTFAAIDRKNFKQKVDHLIQRPHPAPPVPSTFHRVKADIADLDLSRYVSWLASGAAMEEQRGKEHRLGKRKIESTRENGNDAEGRARTSLEPHAGSQTQQGTSSEAPAPALPSTAPPPPTPQSSQTDPMSPPSQVASPAPPAPTRGPNVIAYSKHLCGAATDLTLRCLARHHKQGGRVGVVVVATCCHHVCDNYTYCRPDHPPTPEWVLSDDVFPLVTVITTWAVCGAPVDEYNAAGGDAEDGDEGGRDGCGGADVLQEDAEEGPHWSRLTYPDRQALGLQAKRVLDWGRALWMREQGFEDVRLLEYVGPETSLENVALVVGGGPRGGGA
ncbi:DUF715-domain-containing protein [Gonapodya prolifera JEL478]|uniref:tRNA:m(4)X modification enzyme TRM13 n=1 Tax=Gonapodya prolifera (strain JEL478) TaxID=1344416 RepID=A0A139AGZ8_GONPJ|nr:DUF715-domain-containing protein [Gonapodya prolifera JEL478]|eukprot:KXS16102.1 DUF715-domain-containing protein [Gonapodya prolifera JEL478]